MSSMRYITLYFSAFLIFLIAVIIFLFLSLINIINIYQFLAIDIIGCACFLIINSYISKLALKDIDNHNYENL
jgi:hypothetical protein